MKKGWKQEVKAGVLMLDNYIEEGTVLETHENRKNVVGIAPSENSAKDIISSRDRSKSAKSEKKKDGDDLDFMVAKISRYSVLGVHELV